MPLQPDDGKDDDQANSAGTPQIARKVQKSSRPSAPSRMFCGLPIKVAAEPALVAAASAITNGRGSRPRRCAPAISSGAIAMIRMSLASTAESPPPIATVSASKAAVPRRLFGDRAGAEIDEARFGELSRDDHHREQKRQGRHVDGAAEIVEGHLAARQQRDDREQRDAGAVDPQPGDPPGGHADIGQDQDQKDDRCVHRRRRSLAGRGTDREGACTLAAVLLYHPGMTDPAVLARAPAAEVAYLAGLNEAQRRAVEAVDGPVLVLAGAGTGKTRVLTTRLAHILATGRAFPAELLAVTFTNKAAREMRERLEAMIGRAADGVWLGTFHAIASRILRRHAELVGLKSSFTILDTDDQLRLLKQILAAENIDERRWPARLCSR